MDPMTASALATAAINIGSNIFGNRSKKRAAQQQYQYQLGLQHDAQNFAKWQMANAHQMEVQDLQNAGLNPVLSANNGATAGVTEGSASMANPETPNMMEAINSALNWEQNKAQIKNLEANTHKQESETAKTSTEKEILDIQKEYVKPSTEALINLQNAQSAREKAQKLLTFEQTVLTQAQAFKQKLENDMLHMDKAKRQAFYKQEVELYKAELKRDLTSAGFDSNTTYQAIDRAFATVGKVFSGSVNHSYGKHSSTSNVNVHNTDYNPTRATKIGF